MNNWIRVEDSLPDVRSWVNVLTDKHEDPWQCFCYPDKPRYAVYGAQLREVDSEGYADWQRWQMADGGPIGIVRNVTHWQPLPNVPEEE